MPSRWPPALRILIILLFGVGLAWTGRALWQTRGLTRPARVVLQAEGSPWVGFSRAQERGLLLLLADSLEANSGLPVVLATDLLGTQPLEAAVVSLKGTRAQGTYFVEATLSQAHQPLRRWRAAGPPRTLFQALLKPFQARNRWEAALIPEATEDLTTLLENTGWESDWDLAPRLRLARELVQRQPECASAWLALAGLEHRDLVLSSDANPQGQEACQDHFEKAIAALPAYPRGTHNLAIYFTDIGNQRDALSHLEVAIKDHPRVPHLRSALAYAARTAGLLEIGGHALDSRERLQGVSKAGSGLAENVYLYRGELDRFGATLGLHSPDLAEPVIDFYRGYFHLLKGDRPRALAAFRKTSTHPGSKVLFESLSEIFALTLEGRTDEALDLLNPLRDQRLRLRVPDGEFTFKLAEAYCLLGRHDDALLVAERAFSQGFGCTRWYEATPLLAPLRTTPRWRALVQHLKERQALLEFHFPPSRFQ